LLVRLGEAEIAGGLQPRDLRGRIAGQEPHHERGVGMALARHDLGQREDDVEGEERVVGGGLHDRPRPLRAHQRDALQHQQHRLVRRCLALDGVAEPVDRGVELLDRRLSAQRDP
jgi:hypothetical protein